MYGYQAPPSWSPQGLQPPAPNVSLMQPVPNDPQVVQPPENADVSVDVEEGTGSPTLSGKVKRSKVGARIKLSNFNPDEDVNVVKSWLEICCEPITSTGQRRGRMWDRILQRYNMRRGSYPERSVRSLQSRWDTIKAEVGKFSCFYADVIREDPSGMSDADKTTHAAANFAGVLKHNFAYMHCWEIMKDEPKWQDPKAGASAKSAAGEGFGEDAINLGDDNSSPTPSAATAKRQDSKAGASAKSAAGEGFGEDAINLGDDNSSPTPSAATAKRPMVRDAAEAAKKKANSSPGSTSSSEYASTMKELSLQKISIMQEEVMQKNDRFQQLACIDEKRFEEMRSHNQLLLSIEQEKIRIMREKHDMERQEKEKREDERILAIDLDACTPAQRMYYQALQEEILEKIAARRGKRHNP